MKAIHSLNQKIQMRSKELEKWFGYHLSHVFVPLYSSVDLRVSNKKIVPVDTNIFPAGFNNLTEDFRIHVGELFKNLLMSRYPKTKRILIISEFHTKNRFYWENVRTIKTILEKVRYEVRVGIIDEAFDMSECEFITSSGAKVLASKVKRKWDRVFTEEFNPDIILLNNDCSEKYPNALKNIVQPVEPPVEMGWHTRRKDVHFKFYNLLAGEIADILGIDPWHISIETSLIQNVHFDKIEDRKRVYEVAKKQLSLLNAQYKDRGLEYGPMLFIKSNSGTYGMAVVSVTDIESIVLMNANNRKRLRVTKGGRPVRDIVLQEGIPTVLQTKEGYFAEPVMYLVDDGVAGGFFRVNVEKKENENLNSRGMLFKPFFETVKELQDIPKAFELISKIAVLASGYEIEQINGFKSQNLKSTQDFGHLLQAYTAPIKSIEKRGYHPKVYI